jgi:subtilisin family serine protease
MKLKIVFLVVFFLFSSFISPSFSIIGIEIEETNMSYIEILPPREIYSQFLFKPEKWEEVYLKPKSLSKFLLKEISEKYEEISNLSLDEIAKLFNATMYVNDFNYATSHIEVQKEKYENLVNVLKSIGFEVNDLIFDRLELNESVNSMGLPYQIGGSDLTGRGIRIAILDTGIDDSHKDFSGRLRFWNDTTTERYSSYTDANGHGTHVAGIIAGNGSESSGKYKGAAPEAELYIWKVVRHSDGVIDACWVADAIEQTISQNVNVISYSLGRPATLNLCSGRNLAGCELRRYNAIINALNRGIVFVAAQGNSGPTGSGDYPGCIDGVIAVGSTAKKDYPNNVYNPLLYLDSQIPYRNKLNINVNSEVVSQFTNNAGAIITDLEQIDGFPLTEETGVHLTLQPSSWPANINFNLESEHKDRPCYSATDVWWDPNGRDNGDGFWNLASQNFAAGPYVGFEILLRSHYNGGGWGCCPGDTEPWYNSRTNTFSCSGTPKVCNDFDPLNRNGCENQLGCSWCGCGLFYDGIGPTTCSPDMSEADCHGCSGHEIQHCYVWVGCNGAPTNCNDQSRIGWPYRCGSPDTTGCTGTWTQDSETYRNIFIKNTPGTKDFVSFWSSRGPAPHGTIKPDVTAPGEFICAAKSSEGETFLDICGNNKYHAASGTSMATPHVSGLVALLKQVNPSASVCDIRKVLFETAEPAGYGSNVEGYGRVNGRNAIETMIDLRDNGVSCDNMDAGYSDTEVPEFTLPCQTPFFERYENANQMRDYYCGAGFCQCSVRYDSYIEEVSVSGITSGDVSVITPSDMIVNVSIINTGFSSQNNWYLGVEFWNVSDYNDPFGSRDAKGRINAYYNGADGTHGCVLNPDPLHGPIGHCPSGVDCSIISEDFYENGILDFGETITVSCKAPSTFYSPTKGNQRIMFWVHERDLTQDATNDGDPDGDGNVGDWWWDALARVNPANVRVVIQDTTPPQYSNPQEPTDPSVYSPSATYNFNITWTDNFAVDQVILEMNGVNYTASKSGDTYSMTFSTCQSSGGGGGGGRIPVICSIGFNPLLGFLPFAKKKKYRFLSLILSALMFSLLFAENAKAESPCLSTGTYYYKWYAKDTFGNQNSTGIYTFTVYNTDPVTVKIISPENKTYSTSSINLNYTASSPFPICCVSYSLDDKPKIKIEGNITLNVSEGSHNVIVYANTTYNVTNSSEKVYFTFSIPKPDLIIEDVSTTGNTIYYKINNQGNANAGYSYSNLYVDNVYKANDYVVALSSGSSSNEYFSYSWACSGTSDSIKVCADANNNVVEGNENNNCLTKTVTCPTQTCTCTNWEPTFECCYSRYSSKEKWIRTCTPKGCQAESKCEGFCFI